MIRTFFTYAFIALLIFAPTELSAPKKKKSTKTRTPSAPRRGDSHTAPLSPREQMDLLFRELNNVQPVTPTISIEADEDATLMVVFMQQLTARADDFFAERQLDWKKRYKNPFNSDPFTIGFIHGTLNPEDQSTEGSMTSFHATAMKLRNKDIITFLEFLNLIAFFEGFSLAMREISDMVIIHPNLQEAVSVNFNLGFQTCLERKPAPRKCSLVCVRKEEGSLPILLNVALTTGYKIAHELLTPSEEETTSTHKAVDPKKTEERCGAGSGRGVAEEYTDDDIVSPEELEEIYPMSKLVKAFPQNAPVAKASTPVEPTTPLINFLSGFCDQIRMCQINSDRATANYAELLIQYYHLLSAYKTLTKHDQVQALKQLSIIDGMIEAIQTQRQFTKSRLNCSDDNQIIMQLSFQAGSTATLDALITHMIKEEIFNKTGVAEISQMRDVAYFRGAAVAQDISNTMQPTPVTARTTTIVFLNTLKELSLERKPAIPRSKKKRTPTSSTTKAATSAEDPEAVATKLKEDADKEVEKKKEVLAAQAEKRRLDLEKSKEGTLKAAERKAKKAADLAKAAEEKRIADKKAAAEQEQIRTKAAHDRRLAQAAEKERIAKDRAAKAARKSALETQAFERKNMSLAETETRDYDAALLEAEEQEKREAKIAQRNSIGTQLKAFKEQVLTAKANAQRKEIERQQRKIEFQAERAQEALEAAEVARKSAESTVSSSPRSSHSEASSSGPSPSGSYASSTTGPTTPQIIHIPTKIYPSEHGFSEALLIVPQVEQTVAALKSEAREQIQYLNPWIMHPGVPSSLEYWRGRLAGYEHIEKEKMKAFTEGLSDGMHAFKAGNETYEADINKELTKLSGDPKNLATMLRRLYLQGCVGGYQEGKFKAIQGQTPAV